MKSRSGRLRLVPRRIGRTLAAVTTLLIFFAVGAPAAHADSVWAAGDRIIINVQTGGKNFSNHTQWVSSITIEASTAASNDWGCGVFEAWTQNYYRTTQACGTQFYYISRWVGTGNYVCGAFTAFGTGWPRTIACIAIRV